MREAGGAGPDLGRELDEALGRGREPDALVPGALPEGSSTVLVDAEAVVVSADVAAERLFGVPLGALRGRHLLDARWAPVDVDGAPVGPRTDPVARSLATGEPVRAAVLGIHRPTDDGEGEHVWLEVSTQPLFRSADERPYALLATFADVTGQLAEALAVQHAARNFRLLAERSADIVTRQTGDTTYQWVSPSVSAVLGRRPQDLVGSRAIELLHPDDAPRALATLRRVARGDTGARVTVRARHADGHWVWLETTGTVVTDEHGAVVELQTTSRDVSVRVLAEQERDQAVARLSLVLELAPIGMALLDLRGRCLVANPALCRMTGYSAAELRVRTLVDITHPEDREATRRDAASLRAGLLDALSDDKRYVRADGSTLWVNRSITLARDAAGEPLYYVANIEDITARKQAQQELLRRATTHPLTGMPNRAVLIDRLGHALAVARRTHRDVGLLFIDLDRFKAVNDSLGHQTGDQLLVAVARRLRETVRDEDTAVHLAADEFVVLTEQATDPSSLRGFAERVALALGQPYVLDGRSVDLTASIGATLGDGPDAETLLHRADAAMVRAKRTGRACINVDDQAAQVEALDTLRLESELRQAVEGEQLVLHYQPIVSLPDGRVVAREALVRWAHPTRGLLAPDDFLPAAEDGRLVVRLGQWVLQHATAAAARWDDGAAVAVNVSPRHLADAGFTATVDACLAASGLPAQRLHVEITETAVLWASPSTRAAVTALVDRGVTLALDDFGTGRSTITALHRLPVRTLKIDRSFVADVTTSSTSAALVHGLIALGDGMGLDVVAEGVETDAQARWLQEHGCPLGQGFAFGRPAPDAG